MGDIPQGIRLMRARERAAVLQWRAGHNSQALLCPWLLTINKFLTLKYENSTTVIPAPGVGGTIVTRHNNTSRWELNAVKLIGA